MTLDVADAELKTKHRVMWGKGDYPLMVDTFLLPIGQRLADAAGISPGVRVLDVAAGTGNASIPAGQRGARVTASDLTPELLAAGAKRPEADGLDIEWVEADAENLPFEAESFDIVMSAIGVMFAPHHQAAADELVRVCRPGGTIALLSWTPEGMLGDLFRTMKPFAPPPPPGAQPPPLWGSEEHLAGLFGNRVDFHTLRARDASRSPRSPSPATTASTSRPTTGPRSRPGPMPTKDGREREFDEALDQFCDKWNLGTPDHGRFEKEYLLAIGTRL